MSYVKVDSLKKSYGEKTVLNNLSFTINKGEFVTLLGQSGCGKSTLLRALAGIIDVNEGTISVGDKDITHLPSRKREIGMVFQSYALFPNMTVMQNISYGLKMKKRHKQSKQDVQQMIDLMGLDGLENRYPHELSGGQQQRVALARALIVEPNILLLDEPLSALDAKIRKTLQEEIKRIQRELQITTIFVTHDQKEAMILSDTIYIMNEGNIEQSGRPETIYTKPKNKFVASFIGSYNILTHEEMTQCMESSVETNAKEVAIRPESIYIFTGEDGEVSPSNYVAEGKITEKTLSGSLISYQVQLKTKEVQVDQLLTEGRPFEEGTKVKIAIPMESCIPI